MTFQFKIQIKGITKPPVWRKVKVPSTYTFKSFHHVIQVAFDWQFAHLYQFSPNGYDSYPLIKELYDDDIDFDDNESIDAHEHLLSDVFYSEGQKFTYIYDFGDDWTHLITLEKILEDNTKTPEILAGKGKCPPEDCGGIWGYQNMKEILADKKHPEYKEYLESMGMDENEHWDPAFFDLQEKKKLFLECYIDHDKFQPYIDQLVEDLDNVANNPPTPAYIESPLDNKSDISELALVPFKPISEWTGIAFEVFPEEYHLSEKQCQQVIDGIYRVFDAMNIALVDTAVKKMPVKDLYFIITTCWDNLIQYLPNAGFDLELCTGDPDDCPYGDHCSCGEYWEDEKDHNDLDERFNKVIPPIAKEIRSGFTCYLNMDTLEYEFIKPDQKLAHPQHQTWEEYCEIEPIDMESTREDIIVFFWKINDNPLQNKVDEIIEQEDVIEQFSAIIKTTPYYEDWLAFHKGCTETYVKQEIWNELNSFSLFPEDINGIFTDDGEKIDPQSVPVPELCINCKKYQNNDPEENLLCTLNRHDQRNNDNFECGMFKPI